MTKIITDDFDSEIFNKVAPHPLQSWEWGEARKKMGIEVVRLGEFDGKKLKNVFQITFHKISYTSFTIGYLPRSVILSSEALKSLVEEGKKKNAIFIKLEPYIRKDVILRSRTTKNPIPVRSFADTQDDMRESSHPLFPSWTQVIDLTQSEEELLAKMKPKTRYNIGLAQRKGVVIKEMTNEAGFEIFSKLYFETCRRQRYLGHDHNYHKIIFEALKEKTAHIFIAFYTESGKTTPLASYEIFTFNDVMYYPYGGSSIEYRNLMAPNLLMWEIVRFGKKSGFKVFDLWGSLPPGTIRHLASPNTSDWAGFTRFKEGYGGQFVEFVGSYDLVINKSLYSIYNILYKIRMILL